MSPSDIHNEWEDMGDYKELLVLMTKDLQRDGSLRCRFPLVRTDSETAISKGRRRKPDDCAEIPHVIQVRERTKLKRNEKSCLQLTFDGHVISVGAGEHRAYPDFCQAIKRSRKKSQKDATQLAFDGSVITVKEGQAFPDLAASLKKHQRNCKIKKARGHSSFQEIIQSVLHIQ
jgi:hypothetical protein